MLRRALASLIALLVAVAAIAQEETPPDVPAGEARISGRVLQGETGTPVAGVEVVLYALSADGVPGLRRTTSDASGGFTFEQISGTAQIAYLVGARHRGIPVPGGRVAFAPGQTSATVDIRVADLTGDLSRVRIREQTLRLYREQDALRIEETLDLELPGAKIAHLPAGQRTPKAAGLRARLPEGATDFRMPLGVIPEGLARDGDAVRYYGPFYPGLQDLVWAYRLAARESGPDGLRFRFTFTPAIGAEALSVLVPADAGAFDAPGLANLGAVEDNGRSVTRYGVAAPKSAYSFSLLAPAAHIDPSALAAPEVQVIVQADDAAMTVSEIHLLRATGAGLLLGTPQAPLLRVPLPAGASDVRFGSEAKGLEFAPGPDGAVDVLGSLAPGEVPVHIAYRLAVPEGGAQLAREFAVRVPLVRVFVADHGRLAPSAQRLHRARPVRTEDLNYLSFEAFDLAPGEKISLTLGALPPRSGASPTTARAVAAVAALALVFWLLRPVTTRGAAEPQAAAEPERNEREALYDAIRDLDHDFETAKVSAEDHAQLRGELRAKAAALIAAQEGAPAPPAQPHACPSCGAAAQPEHRFCASCGAALGAPA
jgi:hypothetical protein